MTESYSAGLKRMLSERTAASFGFSPSDEPPADDCCRLSFFAALLMFGTKYSKGTLIFTVKNEALADLFASSAAAFFSLTPTFCAQRPTLFCDAALERVLRACDLSLSDGVFWGTPLPVCAHCFSYFLRGVFLCCGTVSSPQGAHQLNLFTDRYSKALLPILREAELDFRLSARRGHDYLYIKKATALEAFFIRVGAQGAALELINKEIEREMRADINRKNNFDTANISRSSTFLLRLGEAVEQLEERGKVDGLPDSLKVLVRLVKQFPEDSLGELGARIHPPLSKSGLYHRAKKLIDLAEKKEL